MDSYPSYSQREIHQYGAVGLRMAEWIKEGGREEKRRE
jgi:hypothetical protein